MAAAVAIDANGRRGAGSAEYVVERDGLQSVCGDDVCQLGQDMADRGKVRVSEHDLLCAKASLGVGDQRFFSSIGRESPIAALHSVMVG